MHHQQSSSLHAALPAAPSAHPDACAALDVDHPLDTLATRWHRAEADADLALGLRCALLDAGLRSLSANLTPELLVALVTVGTPTGRWAADAALAQVAQMPSEYQRNAALTALLAADLALPPAAVRAAAGTLPVQRQAELLAAHLLPDEVAVIAQAALCALLAISHEQQRWWAVAALVPALPDPLLPQMLPVILSFANATWRQHTLRSLVQRMQGGAHAYLCAALLAAVSAWDAEDSADALELLAPIAPLALLPQLETAARAIASPEPRGVALAALLPRLDQQQRAAIVVEVVDAAAETRECWWRARLLVLALPHLTAQQREAVLPAALAAIARLQPWSQGDFLPALLPYLLEDEREQRCKALLNAAYDNDEHKQTYGQVVALLAPHLSPALLDATVARARKLTDAHAYETAFGGLAAHLTPAQAVTYLSSLCAFISAHWHAPKTLLQQLTTLPTVLPATAHDALNTLGWQQRAAAIATLAPHLDAAYRQQVYHDVVALDDAEERANCLIELLPVLPADQQAAARAAATSAAHAIADAAQRRDALCALAALLPAAEQPAIYGAALAAAQHIDDGQERIRLLVALLPHLAEQEQTRVYARVLTCADTWDVVASLEQSSVLGSPALLWQALDALRGMADAERRAAGLLRLAPHLPTSARTEIFDTLRADDQHALGLLRAFPELPVEQRELLCDAALTVARGHPQPEWRTRQLIGVLPYLAPHQRETVYMEVRATLNFLYWHIVPYATELITAATSLSEAMQRDFYARAITAVSNVEDQLFVSHVAPLIKHIPADLLPVALAAVRRRPQRHAQAVPLAIIAARLPHAAQADVYAEALDATARAPAEQRARTLTQLVPHLPQALLPRAVSAARSSADATWRTFALAALLPHLPPDERAAVCTSISAVPEGWMRAQALALLAPHVDTALLPLVVEGAVTISEGWNRTGALAAIAPRLSGALLVRALEAACAIADAYEGDRAQALAALAPRLAAEGPSSVAHWHAALRTLARYGRADLRADVRALLPWLVALAAPPQRAAIAEAVGSNDQ